MATMTEFKRKRNYLNLYIKKLKEKDHILVIAGPGKLDNSRYFQEDGIHMTCEGLRFYAKIVSSTIFYIQNLDRR